MVRGIDRKKSDNLASRRGGGAPDAQTYYHRGNTYFEKGNYEKAIENYNMAIILNPHFSEAYFSRALSYYYLKNYDRAITDYSKSLELDPSNPVIYNNLGDAYYRKQNFDRAIENYDKAIELNNKYLKAYYNRGLAYACKEDFDTAIENFDKVIKLNPNFAEAYHVRGLAYDYKNDLNNAIKDYEKSLELDPNLEDAKKHLELAKSKAESGGMESIPTGGAPGEQGKQVDTIRLLSKPKINFSDIAGMEKLKEQIRDAIVYPLMKPDLARKYGTLGGGGILLYGPPGCGKTYIMKAAAGEGKLNFINVKLSDVLDQYVGGTEKNIHKIFEMARKNTPCIMFVDEIDALGGRRDKMGESAQYLKAAVNQLLYEMDGIEANNQNVLVVGATNAPWDVDPALRRAGRFSKTIYVPAPKLKSRVAILKIHSRKRPVGRISWYRLGIATMGYSSADLKAVVEDASAIPWKEAFKTGKERKISMNDFIKAIKNRDSTLPPWYAQAKKEIGQQEEKTIVDGKEHLKITESKLGPAEKQAFKPLLNVIKKQNKWYWKLIRKLSRIIGLYLPIPF
ncbi:tetratricopeptide repeat protein [Candidatus Micrarchaeota archaeon]|nr:tetratricopeptide repeat protein [Candidatus Micrarchaeota archaeon]